MLKGKRPDVCAACAGGGARSCSICLCTIVCVMHCHSRQSCISVIRIDSMSAKSCFFFQPARSTGCTVAQGQYGRLASFFLGFPFGCMFECISHGVNSGRPSGVEQWWSAVWVNTTVLKRFL